MPQFTEQVISDTKHWVERAVIGLNLCPFAKAVYVKNQIRFVVSGAQNVADLHTDLQTELDFLFQADPALIDTTLLIHPHVLQDFLDYNDFLDDADALLQTLDLEGEIQIASFHPDYQFAGTEPEDIANYTNRSPYPTLHLLREASLDNAIEAFPEAAEIFEKNLQTMEDLGILGWGKLDVAATLEEKKS
ncbi:DUF1415 domain-containing protein [Glaciimonas sp. GNP009]